MRVDKHPVSEPAIFDLAPFLRGRLSRVALANLPTPVDRLDGLSGSLGLEIWAKRDDLSSPLYGGNKVRKLELLLGDALARGAGHVWTLGAEGSHHVLATAVHAGTLGLCTSAATFPQPETPHVAQVRRLIERSGCRVFSASCRATLPLAVCGALTENRRRGWNSYRIPAGGSSALGVIGYVSAGLELAEQVKRRECPHPRTVVVALGSCGTAAGLLLGMEMAGLACRLVGVRVADTFVANRLNVYRLAWQAARLLRGLGLDPFACNGGLGWPRAVEPGFRRVSFEVAGEQLGRGYGRPTTEATQAAQRARRLDGILLDTTYTAKTMAHILAAARSGEIEEPVLFWHTLGDLGALARRHDPLSSCHRFDNEGRP
jgi:D-cysteine desulfhydrase